MKPPKINVVVSSRDDKTYSIKSVDNIKDLTFGLKKELFKAYLIKEFALNNIICPEIVDIINKALVDSYDGLLGYYLGNDNKNKEYEQEKEILSNVFVAYCTMYRIDLDKQKALIIIEEAHKYMEV